MILYIHGFASSGKGAKAALLRRRFKTEVLAPSLSHIPELALDTLEQIVEWARGRGERVGVVGSSLGGFYATVLALKYDLRAVLVNPSVKPYETLAPYAGSVTNFHDLSSFEWSPRHIESLKRLDPGAIGRPENFFLLLQSGDETLDYRVAQKRFAGARIVVEEGGSHAFEGFERYLEAIEAFLNEKESHWKRV
ncbi:YqiA/YcfP family alpha/beta fold hydrolase [Hydrogenimonas sp.]